MKKENIPQTILKNSLFNFLSTLIGKFGGLIFTLLLARLLLPELFGLYNLVLSIVLIAIIFTDFGINGTALRYISEAIGKNKTDQARSYFKYLFKLKGVITLIVILFLILIAKPLSFSFFNKPESYWPLIVATVYILAISSKDLFLNLFYALRDIKKISIVESILQLSKIVLAYLVILFIPQEQVISAIFLALAVSIFISLLVSMAILGRKNVGLYFGKSIPINKSKILNYLKFMSLTAVSLVLFGSIDTLMLGRYVDTTFIGYYRAALSLVLTIAALFSISNILLPVFTQLNKNQTNKTFKEVTRYLTMLTFPAIFGVIILSKDIINAVYGPVYLPAVMSLYALSSLIIISPKIVFYTSLFQAKEKINLIVKHIITALVINITLNYVLIKNFTIAHGPSQGIVGAGISTSISWGFLLLMLIKETRKNFDLKLEYTFGIKALISSLTMSFVILLLPINILIINIVLGIIVYFTALLLIKGLTKTDLKVLKILKKN